MKYYVVFDTNVIVSSLLTRNPDAPTVRLVDMITDEIIKPVYSRSILEEYDEVLRRPRFSFSEETVERFLWVIRQFGENVDPMETEEPFFRDSDDKVFYEVVMTKKETVQKGEDAYLVTGNQKHFPERTFIVTPAELISIIEEHRFGIRR